MTISLKAGYVCAIVAVALTAGLRQLLAPILGDNAPLVVFMLPVSVVAIFWGSGPGAFATFLSAAFGATFFLGEIGFHPLSAFDIARLVLFIAIGLILSVLAGRLVQAQKEAVERAEQLRLANSRKDEFIAMLGHELRNPLSGIRSAFEVMKATRQGDARYGTASMVLARQLDNINRLLDELLDVSRFNLGLIDCQKKPVNLADVVHEAVSQCLPLIERQEVQFNCELPEDPVWVTGDRLRLVQSLSNLLANAAKYTQPGGLITLCLKGDEKRATLTVEDNGTGINPELLSHIFESFVQEERSLSRSEGGFGLGLSVVQKIVGLHGGTVSAESDGPRKGSRFTIVLPRS